MLLSSVLEQIQALVKTSLYPIYIPVMALASLTHPSLLSKEGLHAIHVAQSDYAHNSLLGTKPHEIISHYLSVQTGVIEH